MGSRALDLLPALELEPVGRARHAVLWLHGLGADGPDFPSLVPRLGLDPALAIRWIFPHAPALPVAIHGNASMPAWYDIRSVELAERQDEGGIRRSARQVTRLLAHEVERGVPAARIVLAGFSQGGALAAHVALRHPEALAGLVCLSSYLVLPATLEAERTPANAALPTFQAHGTFDPLVRLEHAFVLRERLSALGHALEWHTYPMRHQVCAEELHDLARWLERRLGP